MFEVASSGARVATPMAHHLLVAVGFDRVDLLLSGRVDGLIRLESANAEVMLDESGIYRVVHPHAQSGKGASFPPASSSDEQMRCGT